mgnify:CR=1 FL=1
MNRIMAAIAVAGAAATASAQTQPYYITDGDASTMFIVQNGSLQATKATYNLGYPIAVRNTIWLGHRDDAGAFEYDLFGDATGGSSAGGNGFSQLLDGATGIANNYGIECCGGPNSVTIADPDWSNQKVLFNLPGGAEGVGIAYATSTNTLFAMFFFEMTVNEYDLNGTLLNRWNYQDQFEAALAYEASTNTLWTAQNSGNIIRQYALDGTPLQTITVAGLGNFGNIWGGEMQIPAPGSLALVAAGGLMFRRRR